jgi:hypothetical protein
LELLDPERVSCLGTDEFTIRLLLYVVWCSFDVSAMVKLVFWISRHTYEKNRNLRKVYYVPCCKEISFIINKIILYSTLSPLIIMVAAEWFMLGVNEYVYPELNVVYTFSCVPCETLIMNTYE